MTGVRGVLLLLIFVLLSACASRIKYAGKVDLLNEKLNYPVSFTPYIHLPNGEIAYYKSKDHANKLKKVGNLKIMMTKWLPKRGLDYSFKYDVSEKINKQIKKVGGDAIVNFKIIAGNSVTNFYSKGYSIFTTWLGIIGLYLLVDEHNTAQDKNIEDPNSYEPNYLPGYLLTGIGLTGLISPILFKLPSKIEVILKGDIVKFQN